MANCPVCQRPIGAGRWIVPVMPELSVSTAKPAWPPRLVELETCSRACGETLCFWLERRRQWVRGHYRHSDDRPAPTETDVQAASRRMREFLDHLNRPPPAD